MGFFPSAVFNFDEPRILKGPSCPDVVAMTMELGVGVGIGWIRWVLSFGSVVLKTSWEAMAV